MLHSERRAAPRRRWVGARGRRAGGILGFGAARTRTGLPKCQELPKSELQRLLRPAERVLVSRPGRGPHEASGAAARGSGGRVRRAKIRPPFRRALPRCFPCAGPSRRRWPWPRASRRLPLRRQRRAQPPGGGAPVAEPAPAPRGALAPGLTGGAPQAGWRESPRHGRQAPPRSARGRERHPAGPRWAAAAPPRGKRGWGGRCCHCRAEVASSERGGRAGRLSSGSPSRPQARLLLAAGRAGSRASARSLSRVGSREELVGAATAPAACGPADRARELRTGGGHRRSRAGPASPPPQGPLSLEAAGKPSQEVGEAPKGPWLLRARGRAELAGAAAGRAAVPEPRASEAGRALLPHCAASIPGGPRAVRAWKAASHRREGLDITGDFCIWCKVLRKGGGGDVDTESIS